MSALKRVWQAPSAVLWTLAFLLVPAWLLGRVTRAGVGAGLGNNALQSSDQILPALVELLAGQNSLAGILAQALPLALVVALVLWMTVLGGVIARLAEKMPMAEMAKTGASSLPGLVAISLWHLPVRALFGILPLALARRLPDGVQSLGFFVAFLFFAFCTCALDFGRCRVVLEGERGWHPWTLLRSLRDPLTSLGALASSSLLSGLQWAALLFLPWWTLNHLGDAGTLGVARVAAIVAALLGLTRLAVVVGVVSERVTQATDDPAEVGTDFEPDPEPEGLDDGPNHDSAPESDSVSEAETEPDDAAVASVAAQAEPADPPAGLEPAPGVVEDSPSENTDEAPSVPDGDEAKRVDAGSEGGREDLAEEADERRDTSGD